MRFHVVGGRVLLEDVGEIEKLCKLRTWTFRGGMECMHMHSKFIKHLNEQDCYANCKSPK